MSWWLHVMTLHQFEQNVAAWATEHDVRLHDCAGGQAASPSYPEVAEVLGAFRRAGCHGMAWYKVSTVA